MRKIALIIACAVMAGVLTSCLSFVQEGGLFGGGSTDEPNGSTIYEFIPNAQPADMAKEDCPLFVGAKWVYRNSTPDINPEIHSGYLLIREVVSTVMHVDPLTNIARECFVLRIQQDPNPTVQCYLHKTSEGLRLYGVETLPYSGAPDLIPCGGSMFMNLPLRKGDSTSFELYEGTTFDSEVLSREYVSGGSVFTLLGPYSGSFANSWRVRTEYGGILADALGSGIEETWYSQGVGMIRRTANSLVYELMDFRSWDEVLFITEDTVKSFFSPPAGSVVVVQLREWEGSQSWQFANEAEVAAAGVLSLLSGHSSADVYSPDIDDSGRIDSGSCVYMFEVRTTGRETLEFANETDGSRMTLNFGKEQPPVLSQPSVSIQLNASTAMFSVKYLDPDGIPPTVSFVCVDGETCYPMEFSHGKLADGFYTSHAIQLERGLHTYCFRFSDNLADAVEQVDCPAETVEHVECELGEVFDIGGALPFPYP